MKNKARRRWNLRALLAVFSAVCLLNSEAADSAKTLSVPAAFTKPVPGSISDLKTMEKHIQALVKQVSPAVVALEMGFGTGSGVIISSNGLILTAAHVMEHANKATVTFPDGRKVHAKVLGQASESDAGLLKITEPGPWPCAGVGDMKNDRVGSWVLALGHPGGFDSKRSLVVRLGRIISLDENTLQTDCTISPGDSGGPVINMAGKVIGIHSFISISMADNFHMAVSSFSNELEGMSNPEEKP